MIIDSKKYSEKCSCGKSHEMTTELCLIESGALSRLEIYAEKYGLSGFSAAVYDENTYRAFDGVRPRAGLEVILPPDNLHANEHGVELLMKSLPEKVDFLIALGSGTIHDITRYCAYLLGIDFISCPSAASVDGFCSSVAAMTWHCHKKTLSAVAPKLVIADLDVISKAPIHLARAGFGDMIGKLVALTDWKIANLLTGEHLCKSIYDITLDATRAVIDSAEGIKNGDASAYEKLTYGLLMSGIAMQLLGSSRCASGAEHHISHFIEVGPQNIKIRSDALHGEKVGVGTMLAVDEYRRLTEEQHSWCDYPPMTAKEITEVFGETLAESVIAETATDSASGITAKQLSENWGGICKIVQSGLPTKDELLGIYSILGIKSTLSDIGIGDGLVGEIIDNSPMVRNRLTLMRLRRTINK